MDARAHVGPSRPCLARCVALVLVCVTLLPGLPVVVALAIVCVTRFPCAALAQSDPAAARAVSAEPTSDGEQRDEREEADASPRTPRRTPRLEQRGGARRIRVGDVATTGAYVGALLGLRAIDRPTEPSWTQVNGFDKWMRGGLRLGTNGRDAIATASDALLFTLAAYPLVVDDLSLVLIGDRNPSLAARLMAIDAQAFALMGLLVGITKVAAGRERPYAGEADCQRHPDSPECTSTDRNMSFFSGHAAMAFTGAGLACFHQQQVPGLYGSRAAGLAMCGSAMALATSTALFRVFADKHWTTDVLVGAGVGLFSGWLLPWLLHGKTVLDFDAEHVQGSVSPILDRGTFGLGVSGSF